MSERISLAYHSVNKPNTTNNCHFCILILLMRGDSAHADLDVASNDDIGKPNAVSKEDSLMSINEYRFL
jgi:hypothetical protein